MKNRISLAIFLLLISLYSWAQIGGDYNPSNPSDPGNPTQEYTLSLKATPSNGGSFNTTSTNLAGGKTYTLRAYPSTDFAFVAWLCNGDTLSKSSSYTYTMPYHDVEIIGVFTYSPSNPSDPSVIAQKYTLTMKATPSEGGSFNTTSTKVSVGERYNLRAYPNSDFAFVAWLCEGDTLSKSASYDYTMPSHNVDITGVFTYRPSSPSDPQEQALKYQLSLTAVPMNSGSFNISNERLAVGSSNSLRAYANTDFVFRHWMIGDSVLSTNPNMDFVMPSHNVQMVGVFEYNPASPANPNRNHWDKQTGEVIVDDFTPGNLSSAISSVISGSSSNDVQMIIVSGRITNNDFGIANNYKNCSLLDLSRVTGVTEVPSYAFDYTNFETVYLPATIEKIGARAFAECTKLSSLTIYAMIPPTLESNVFQGVPEGLVVYVPAAAIAQYQDVEAWGKFTLLPIQEDIRSISISLPEGANTADYTQMWLELTNTKSGQRMHYVMTDRQTYTFANIIRNTSWNVTLRNERGDVFGQIDNVEVKDEDVNVVFSSLSKPQSVVLSVLTPDGQDVTGQAQVTWTDAQGSYLAQGVSLAGLPTGYQTTYRIVLSQELAMTYNTPQPVDYALTDGNNSITCRLNAIPLVKISGKVKDASTRLPLSGAVISASQTFGGKYSKTLNAKTDANGMYTLDIANVPTSVAFAASDYVSQTINCDSLLTGAGEVTLPDVSLKTITGATITLGFTYTSCDGETQNWYSDYQNVSYELFNVTKNKAISQYNVQYPQIVLLEEVADGDVLRLTATSRTNTFMPVAASATIAEQKAEATFAIVELGKIQSSFTSTGNAAVVGSLYDAAGKLLKTYNYSEASLTISDLADGNYTLVSMGNSRLFNTIYDLSQLPQTGLVVETDYVQNSVEVKSGQVSAISISEVPTLDESKLYYTGDNTSFTVNKPSIVAGNYLTLTGRIDFKPTYATTVSNVQMIVDLPESCEFVENSVMVGNSTSSYTLNGNQITIPMNRYTDRVRFCIIPTLGGEYAPSAFVQFDLNGETVTQPIGSANYTAKDLSISVPSTVAKTAIPVSGTAIGKSDVEIYDDGVLIGQTTSLANGTWATTCELNEPYNLSTHIIFAKVTTKTGIGLVSETVNCLYDKNAIEVNTVTMINTAHTSANLDLYDYVTVFDFQNPKESYPAYWYWPSYPDFTFLVDFTNNDTTIVKDVVLYVFTDHDEIVTLYPEYDAKKDMFVATAKFGSYSLPYNVSVDFINETGALCSRSLLKNSWIDTNKHNSENDDFESTVSSLLELEGDTLSISIEQQIDEMYGESLNYNADLDTPDENIVANAKNVLEQINGNIQNRKNSELIGLKHLDEYVNFDLSSIEEPGLFVTESCEGINEAELRQLGYEAISVDDNSTVYVRYSDTKLDYVDFGNNLHVQISFDSETTSPKARFRANGDSNIAKIREYISKINKNINTMENWANVIKGILDELTSGLNSALGDVARDLEINNKQLAGLANFMERHVGDVEEWNDAKASYDALLLQRKQLRAEQSALHSCKSTLAKAVSKITSVLGLIQNMFRFSQDLQDYVNLYYSVPTCECNPSLSDELKSEIARVGAARGLYYFQAILSDVAAVHSAYAGVVAAPASGGTSISVTVAAVSWVVIQIGINAAMDKLNANVKKKLQKKINDLIRNSDCWNCPPPKPKPNPNPTPPPPPGGGSPNVKDPSGYVYEGVASNRIEGVTATAYYKEMVEDMYGDLHENIVKWDASEYAQENPLFTNEYGMYAWDVPNGLWQVKFEKEGYETTYSEWLPVPPPQLDINIPMKQNRQPEVKAARAYEDAVEVEFDKYMMPELLSAENIMVMQNGTVVEGTVELLNEEVSYEGEAETFASKIRFNAAQPFTEQEIALMVNNRVRSYAGIRMQDNYQQTFTIEQEIKQIVSDSVVTVGYGNASTFVISVLPASASKGKTLTVKTSSPMILGVETEMVTIGNDGKAEIIVSGELPGTAALTFSVEGTDKTAMTIANVEQIVIKTVATPKASIASGTVVEKGTAITLTCETEGATIYYTLDGSCPCDNTDARKVYDGTPIIINETVTIKAMAMAPDMYESDVAEFTYLVEGTGIDDVLINGQIQIYPLPVRDKVNITAGGKVIKSVTISSMNGVVVASTGKPTTIVTLDVSRIPTGIYIINVVTVDRTFSRKILKVE